MTSPSSQHGAGTRRPVVHGGRTIRGLHQRTLKDGATVYEARLRIDGKDRTIRLDADTKSDAVREFENLRADRNRGVEHENQNLNPTVADAFEEWIAHLESRVGIADERLRIAESYPTTARSARARVLQAAPWFGRVRIADVRTAHLRRLLAALGRQGYSSATVTQALRTVSAVCSFAVKQGYVTTNIVRHLSREDRPSGKRKSEPRYLSADELERLLERAEDDYRPALATMAYAGLRLMEALGLRWGDDLDFDEGLVIVNGQLSRAGGRHIPAKTAASHAALPMLPTLKRELLRHRARQAERNLALVRPGRFVFTRANGQPYGFSSVCRAMADAGTRAGLNPLGAEPVGCHDLRHSCISIAHERGATLAELAELARHSSPTTTMQTYAGLTRDGRGAAIAKLLQSGFGA